MKSFGVTKVDRLTEMLPKIDFLTVHCPLTDETKGMVGKKELALLKKGANVVNTARGGIIDEKDLYEALTLGHVAGAALDVFEIEPPDPEDPLLKHPNVLATPHYGGTTEESLYRIGIVMVEEVVNFLQGKPVRYPVNPEVLQKKSHMIPIVSIVGKSDSGKTTLIEKLLPELGRRGYRVATVKHDVHGFEVDREGKDSWRHKKAGAHTVVISSPLKVAVIRDVDHDAELA